MLNLFYFIYVTTNCMLNLCHRRTRANYLQSLALTALGHELLLGKSPD